MTKHFENKLRYIVWSEGSKTKRYRYAKAILMHDIQNRIVDRMYNEIQENAEQRNFPIFFQEQPKRQILKNIKNTLLELRP